MENLASTILKWLRLDGLVDHLAGYLEARLELFKAEVREDVARLLAQGLLLAALGLFAFLLLLFFSVGLAHYFNSFGGPSYVGYWLVAALYGFLVLLFWVVRAPLGRWLQRHITSSFERNVKH